MIDTLDWLERLIWDEVCREYGVKSIEKADGGYAKGYTHALDELPEAAWMRIENDPVFAPELLDQERVFTAVLTVTYRVRR